MIRNKYGARGQPCLTPCKIGKARVDFPLTETRAAASLKSMWAMFMNGTGKPIYAMAWKRKPRSILSYAFEKSSLKNKRGWFDCLAWEIVSCIRKMLLRIYLIGRKANWSMEMISIKTGWSRICRVFANNLYDTFSRVIGHQLFSVLEEFLVNSIFHETKIPTVDMKV
jgi:hypothetical protein